jgi:hypothetical protein
VAGGMETDTAAPGSVCVGCSSKPKSGVTATGMIRRSPVMPTVGMLTIRKNA